MKREPRNGLRPVKYKHNKTELNGYFHCFSTEGNMEDGMGMYATVEREDGYVVQVDAYDLKFEDID